ncbi:MAG TPA: adhesin, partial [Flavobacteriales bacterium]|nr:adhesin [Flavobacteriales bacterium]
MTINDIKAGIATISDSTMVLCNGGNNGDATVIMTGGSAPYSYAWNTTPMQTNAQAIELTAGIYTVTITDNIGCTNTISANIAEPAPMVLIPSVIDANCGQANGSVSVNASGGTGTYTYLWDD